MNYPGRCYLFNLPYTYNKEPSGTKVGMDQIRASSYEPGNRAGSVTGMNFVVCHRKFQPGYWDEIQETKPKWHHINKYRSRLS